MTNIVWEDPPEPVNGKGATGAGRWQQLASDLRQHPGKWAVARAGLVCATQSGPLRQRLKKLGCEAVQRKQPDATFTLYARWPEDR